MVSIGTAIVVPTVFDKSGSNNSAPPKPAAPDMQQPKNYLQKGENISIEYSN
jgi:hypothetical protein